MNLKTSLTPFATIVIIIAVATIVVGASVYFYILPQTQGQYKGPGLPYPGVTYSYSVSIPSYGNWTSYGFHSNVSNFWANTTAEGLGGSYQTVAFGLMNQSQFDNLTSNTSLQWSVYQAPGTTAFQLNYHGTAAGNYYLVWIQEGNGNFQNSGKLTLTEIST